MILLSVLFWTAFSLPPSAAESTNSCPNIISLSTAEGLSICGGGQLATSVEVCLQSSSGSSQQIDLEVGLQSGFTVAGGDFDSAGTASTSLMPDSCQSLSITLEADSSRRAYTRALLPVTASSPAEHCMDAENELDALSILVENCAPAQEGFTCPCEGEGKPGFVQLLPPPGEVTSSPGGFFHQYNLSSL